MRIFSLFVLAIVLINCQQLQGQELWTLEKCIDKALSSSIAIQQAELSVLNSEIDKELADKAKYPNLNASTNVGWSFGRTIEPTTNEFITETFFSNNYGLNSGMIVYDGFRIKNNIKKSDLDLKAARSDKEQSKQDLVLGVALNYLNILFSKENIDIANKQLNLNQQQLDQINKSIKAGVLPRAENLNIQAQIAQSEQGIIVAENNYLLAMLQLKQYLRIEPSTEIEVQVPTEFTLGTDPDLITFEEILNTALSRRHDLKSAELRTQSAEIDIELAKSGYYPTISAFGNLGSNYSNQARDLVGFTTGTITNMLEIDGIPSIVVSETQEPILEKPGFGSQLDKFLSYGFGIGVNIPIYNNGQVDGSVERAKLNVENQNLLKAQLVENFKQNVMQALADARAAKKKLEAADKSLTAQQAAFDNVTKRLEIGASNSFEWEAQKTQLENQELSRLNDKYDYLFKVKILDFYLGKPLKF